MRRVIITRSIKTRGGHVLLQLCTILSNILENLIDKALKRKKKALINEKYDYKFQF